MTTQQNDFHWKDKQAEWNSAKSQRQNDTHWKEKW
jgi:hypothetical protein